MPARFALFVVVLSSTVVSIAEAAESPDFNSQVLPVFRKYCNGCHNANDAEAGLVLQDYARAMKGGDDGAVIVAGKSDQSRLWKRLTATDDTKMPPKDQPLPSADDLAMIKTWIETGARQPAGGVSASGLVTPRIPVTTKLREPITSVATALDGSAIALARPHAVEVIVAGSTTRLTGHTGTINEVSFSRDGQWLCVAAGENGLQGEATLWRTADWTRGPTFSGHRDALYSAQLSHDGRQLATASYDRDVIVWDVATQQPLRTFRGHNDAVYSASFSPSGKLLATASGDRTVKLWDVATGQRLDTFAQPSKDQTTVTFSPNGQFVAAGGVDCRVRVWQISETGREGTNPILYARFAHEGPILKLAFSTDGRLLVSSSEDRRIKIWETNTFTQVAVLERQSDWPSALAFTSDNRQLLVGRMNGEYQFYPVDPKWAEAATDLQRLDETIHASDVVSFAQTDTTSEVEPNDQRAAAQPLTVPAIVKGELKGVSGSADQDLYRFSAKRGERVIIETDAARSGSLADTKLEVLNADGKPVLRALLQAVRDSWINFRPIDSSAADVRLEFWEEMDLNQYLYLNGEVCKTFRAPRGPDSGYSLYTIAGKRRNYFDTSAEAHAKDEPAYIVEAFAPQSRIVDNGLPVFPVFFSNDDDGDRKLGKDSRLTFTAPETGTYLIQVTDVRGFSGDKFAYTLNVRHPQPDFSVNVSTKNLKVPAGSGQRLKFTLNSVDGFEGSVRVDIAGLPKGFTAASPVEIQAGLRDAESVLTVAPDAPQPAEADWNRVTILATANLNGQLVTKNAGSLGELKIEKPPQIRVFLAPDDPKSTSADQGLVIEPGTTITANIRIERNEFDDDVKFEVENLPHGIIVDNIGLSGVLVRKKETERQIFLTARDWVPETTHLIYAVSQNSGNQASSAIRLHVRKPNRVAAIKK